MKIKSFRFKHLVSSFLSIMESSKVIVLSFPLCCISMLLGFTHNLSYYFKLRFHIFYDSRLIFLKNAIFFSNFPNILYYLKSPLLTEIVFYGLQGMIYYFIIYLFFIGFMRRYHLNQVLSNSKVITILNYLFQYYVSLFYWILFVPMLEFFSNMIDCDWYTYFDDCSSLPFYMTVLSIIVMICIIINGFFILWLYRTYMFLDEGLLKKKFTMILAILYIAKFILVVIYPLLKEQLSFMVFFILHLVGCYSLFDYIRNFPISYAPLSKFYISILCSFESICLILTFFEYTTIIEESSLFYVLAVGVVFGIKVGLKIFETTYHRMIKSNLDEPQFLGYCLEELYRLYQARHTCAKDNFFIGGILKLHFTKCSNKKCVLNEKTFTKFDLFDIELQNKIMNNFVTQMFSTKIKHSNTKTGNLELMVLKFSSFLNKNNSSPMKAYYEMQKIFSLNPKKSFYFHSISMNILRQIRALVTMYEIKSHQNSDYVEEDKELEIKTFFEMFNEKVTLKKLFIQLLEKRMNFWDKFKDGFHGYEEVFKLISEFMNEVVEFKEILDSKMLKNKNTQKIIFDLKFKTIYECVIFNNVNKALKNEDELDKIKKKELTLEKNILNCHSFFNNNYTTLQASFLHSNGKILESSKKENLAKFFMYSMEEIKSITQIQTLMPNFIAENHQKFITWYLKKDRTSRTKEKKFIFSFGLEKRGFIFPLKVYVGFNFDYNYDLVFHAALLDLGRREEQSLIFNQEGEILGISREFYRFFDQDLDGFKVDLMTSTNIYNFTPSLPSIVQKSNLFDDLSCTNLINQVCQIYFPTNLEEIFSLLALKRKEEAEEKEKMTSKSNLRSVVSIKTNKTAKSIQTSNSSNRKNTNKSKSRFFSKMLQTLNRTATEKAEIENRFQEREITNFELINILINRNNCRRHKINFNLQIIRNYYSQTNCITYCLLVVNKISKDLKEIVAIQQSNRNKFDTFYDPKSSFTVQPSEIAEKLGDLELEPAHRSEDEINSSFVIMPEENKPLFREASTPEKPSSTKIIPENLENVRLITEDNRLLTTENEQIASPEERKSESPTKKTARIDENLIISEVVRDSRDPSNIPKIEERKINKTPPPESFKGSSEEISGFGKIHKLHGVTTSNVRIIDMNDRSSQKSSISNVKKTYTVFVIIGLIQKNFPNCLKVLTLAQILELLIIICYCISIYVMSVQYIENYYNPLNQAVLNFARMYNTYSCTNLVTVEYEYAIYNYSNYQNGLTYNYEFKSIISEAFDVLKKLNNEERSKKTQFDYQNFFKSVMINASDPNLPEMREYMLVEFLDSIIKQLYELEITDFANMTLEKLEYFSINYMNFLDIYSQLSAKLDNEFFQTNNTISIGLEIILILFVILVFLLKCFEYVQLDIYYKKMIRILNIFLRVSQKEAFGEFFLTKDIHQVLIDPMDAFLNYNYIDKVLMKRETKIFESEQENNQRISPTKRKNKEKKGNLRKNISFQDLKPLSKFPSLCFISFFGILVLLYIGLNYYYFVVINDQVKNLIEITIFFEKIYTLPTTVLMINRIILRERIITNKLYNYPDSLSRKEQLNSILKHYQDDLQSTTGLISLYSLDAINNIKDKGFPYLIYGDACETLIINNLITSNEKAQCQTVLNTAFQKGLLNIVTEILRGMNDDEELRVIYTDETSLAQQKSELLLRLKKNVGVDRVTADYYLNKLLMVFYDDLSNYYRDEMLTQIDNLKVVILITTIVLGLILIAVIFRGKRHYEKIYRNISLTLNMIPYEKLLNDEQTLFLIKKYWRE